MMRMRKTTARNGQCRTTACMPWPSDVFPLPPCTAGSYLGGETDGMTSAELRAEAELIERALLLFSDAELASEFGTPEFYGSECNPVVWQTAGYLYLLSDYLKDRLIVLRGGGDRLRDAA
jgi:hypothetical protein